MVGLFGNNSWAGRSLLILLLALFGGCAGIGGQHQGGEDFERWINAIDLDDVGTIRADVAAGRLQINQRIPAPAYSQGAPLVALAARAASLDVLRFLISAKADVNARTAAGETPLMLAAYFRNESTGVAERHDEVVRLLVEAGADLENESNSYTALGYAAYNNRPNALRFLLQKGARVDADAEDRTIYINTPLIMAAIQGHKEIVSQLLRAGADPHVRVKGGHTAREFAVKYQNTHVLPMLQCAESLPPGMRYTQVCEGSLANR